MICVATRQTNSGEATVAMLDVTSSRERSRQQPRSPLRSQLPRRNAANPACSRPHQRQALRAQAPSASQRTRCPGGDLRGAEIPKRRLTTCGATAVAPIKPGCSRRSWRTISTASCRCRPRNPSAAPPNNAPPGGRSCGWAPAGCA